MGGNIIVISSKAEWDSRLALAKAEGKACVVDFHAQWCGPCKMIAPHYVGMSEQYTAIYFLKVDVDAVPEVAEICQINSMPTFQVWKDGVKVGECVGASQEKLRALVQSA